MVESHSLYTTVKDMKRSWQGCRLYEALLAQPLPDPAESVPIHQNYGTIRITSVSNISSETEKGSVYIKIELHKDGPFRHSRGSDFRIQLYKYGNERFKEVFIVEGNHPGFNS